MARIASYMGGQGWQIVPNTIPIMVAAIERAAQINNTNALKLFRASQSQGQDEQSFATAFGIPQSMTQLNDGTTTSNSPSALVGENEVVQMDSSVAPELEREGGINMDVRPRPKATATPSPRPTLPDPMPGETKQQYRDRVRSMGY